MSRTTVKEITCNAGGYTDIALTVPCRHASIEEVTGADSGALNLGYLDVKRIEDNFATNHYVAPGTTLEFGNQIAEGNAFGPLLGDGGQVIPAAYAGGTTYAKGDRVLYSGVAYVSLQDSNVGNTPGYTAYWTPDPNYRAATVIAKIQPQDGATNRVVRLTQTE